MFRTPGRDSRAIILKMLLWLHILAHMYVFGH